MTGLPWLMHLFTAYEPKFRCHIPICDGINQTNSIEEWYTVFALPPKESSSDMLMETSEYDPCHMLPIVANSTECNELVFDISNKVSCDQYVYDDSLFEETLTTSLDLVCENEYKRRLLSSFMVLG